MTINAIELLNPVVATEQLQPLPQQLTSAEPGFSDYLAAGVADVNQSLQQADTLVNKLATGQAVSNHELMLSLQQAKLQLQLGLEVRNKLVEAYQELMRIQL